MFQIPKVLRVEISDEMRQQLQPLLTNEFGKREYGKLTRVLRHAIKEFIREGGGENEGSIRRGSNKS